MNKMTTEFVPKQLNFGLEPQSAVYILGKRLSGKTTVAKELVYHSLYEKAGIRRFMIFVNRMDQKLVWEQMFPSECECVTLVKDEDESSAESLIRNLLETQNAEIEKLHRAHIPKEEFVIPLELRVVVIFDGIIPGPFLNSRYVRELCGNCRMYGVEMIYIAQFINQVIPEIRAINDYVGILATHNVFQLRSIWTELLSEVIPFDEFTDLVVKFTESKGSMLWIDNVSTSKELADKIFVYQSDNTIYRVERVCDERTLVTLNGNKT